MRHGAWYYVDARGGAKPWVLIGRTYADAIVRYAALEAAVAMRRDFNALADRYIVEAKMADSTRTVRRAMLKPLRKVFGPVLPDDIEQIDAYRYMDARGKAVARQEIVLLSAALSWGVKKGFGKFNPLHGIKLDTQPRRKRYLTDAELAAILAAAPTEVAQAVRFMSYTALRVGDALRVRWKDYKADGLHVAVSKTDSALVFDRTPGLVALMADLKQRRIGSLFVIADRQGRQWDYKRLYAEWRKVAPVDANIHDLRRKRITDLTREKGLEFARVLAAHSNPKMTASYDVGEKRVAV